MHSKDLRYLAKSLKQIIPTRWVRKVTCKRVFAGSDKPAPAGAICTPYRQITESPPR